MTAPSRLAHHLFDVSVVVRPGTPEWPGDTPYSCGWTTRVAQGAAVNLSQITMSPHVGTHADAPLHVADGAPASEALAPERFLGRAIVCSVASDRDVVELDDIPTLPRAGEIERLLLRTGRTVAVGSFPERWPVLSVGALEELLARGLRLLGVDTPSVDERHSKTLDVHHALFGGGALNIESLDLRAVADGEYELLALPMRIEGLDASPVRALLRPLG
jgi:arylformamidase